MLWDRNGVYCIPPPRPNPVYLPVHMFKYLMTTYVYFHLWSFLHDLNPNECKKINALMYVFTVKK
jgi:hypothetical protein